MGELGDTMNRQVIMILAHNNIDYIGKMIELLDSNFFDIIIHVDKSQNILPFYDLKEKVQLSNIYFIENRIDVIWSDYSIVEAELEMLNFAVERGYSYYHLISGADFILKTPSEIFNYFEENIGKEYIQFWTLESEQSNYYIDRYKYYNNQYPKIRTKTNKFKYHSFRKISVLIQKLFRVDRLKNNDVSIKLGSQWFSITHEFANYVLNNRLLIEKVYKKTVVPDESFLQTLVYNSKFRNNLYDGRPLDKYDSIKRELYFENSKPHVWTIEDKEKLFSSNNLFARKFDKGVSDGIIDELFNKIKNEKSNEGLS